MPFRYKFSFFILISIWVILIFAEPISSKFHEMLYALPFTQIIFSNVCHQNPDKLIETGYYHTLVCARCTGIYLGAWFSALIILILTKIKEFEVKYLIISLIPVVADVFFVKIGLYNYNKTTAFISGTILGSSVFYYFYKVISSQYSGKN